MTISAVFPVIQRPWKGYEDRGLPVGMWIAQGTTLGDASGGANNVIFVFKAEGEPLGARFYNIEQIEAHNTLPTNADAMLVIENFDIVGPTGLVNRRSHFNLLASVSDAALSAQEHTLLPIFLGRPQLVGLSSQIRLEGTNTLNETQFFTAQGYIWEPRSLLEDGGLRRPLDSLYGG